MSSRRMHETLFDSLISRPAPKIRFDETPSDSIPVGRARTFFVITKLVPGTC